WPNSEASPSGIAVTDAGVWLAALRGKRLWYVPFESDGSAGEPRSYLELGRLRDVILTPDEKLWVVTSNTDGGGAPEVGAVRIARLAISCTRPLTWAGAARGRSVELPQGPRERSLHSSVPADLIIGELS